MHYEPHETVTITLQRFMDMQRELEEESDEQARIDHLVNSNGILEGKLYRIEEVLNDQDMAGHKDWEAAHKAKVKLVMDIIRG